MTRERLGLRVGTAEAAAPGRGPQTFSSLQSYSGFKTESIQASFLAQPWVIVAIDS